MKFLPTAIPGVFIVEVEVFGDRRGCFFECYRRDLFAAAGITADFIQDNQSSSRRGVLRGLHYQAPPHTQAKLVRVVSGRVLDVAVDIRLGSPTFGRHVAVELSSENHRMLYLPRGMAHGFAVLSETAVFAYKCDNIYAPSHERCIRWNDPALGIDWQIPADECILSPKDTVGVPLAEAELFAAY